ncbi:5'-methylthioadenosine/S-adenosylhomocysteine nucleosidase, partial [Bradyrhizobium sp. STM 3809]|uniref:5'-methylthioadenosine/S-adenosylhomocysteine nucleosidase family protein n=1 Tax=Bradyrhizobium sp. STM 3809 TaxID=551936 RepID=UPI0011124FAC
LLKQLRSNDGKNRTTPVIGMSAFPDEIASYRNRFDELGVLMIAFDSNDAWRKSLSTFIESVDIKSTSITQLDFLIVCALEEERQGFRSTELMKVSEVVVGGLNVQYVYLDGDRRYLGGILRLGQMGLVACTYETTLALNLFRIDILCMTGICAGFSKQASLGQIIVGSPAWEYQAGKWSLNGFEIAPTQIPLKSQTRAIIDHTISKPDFEQALEARLDSNCPRPALRSKPKLAPFVTGSAVIADSQRLTHIEQQHRKIAALDMETFGIYFAAHESPNSPRHFFSSKCIVDLADEKKNDNLHQYGCTVSARATELLLRELLRSL